MKTIIMMGLWLFSLLAVLSLWPEFDPPDKYYLTPEIPYQVDPAYKAYQDSLVNRALVKKDTTPYKGKWIDVDQNR